MIRRSGQQWVMDQLFRIAGHDLLFPGALGFRLERGYRYAEVERTMERVQTFRQNAREWAKTAAQLEAMAQTAEARGHTVTAREFYYRASIYYGRGQWSILRDTDEKRALYDKCVAAFEKVVASSDGAIERVALDVEGETVYGVLHLPPERTGPVPAVVFFPGMDMFKEEFPDVQNNAFAKRGLAVLSLDGPGQGETRVKGCTVTDEKYVKAGKAAIDWLVAREEIDAGRIAVSGASFGSYWAPMVAAHDDRVKACAGIMGVLYSMTPIFELAPPSFKANFMYMAGIEDEDDFDRMAARMGLSCVGAKITCPTLITQGDCDFLCPVEGADRFFCELAGPKEMWLFENEYHPLGGVMAHLIPWLADWLNDAFAGKFAADHAVRTVHEPL
ncbi:alpha/beta hydrolase family protein [Acuticoccus mangrovi]|uniref:Alpha/beta hydrolase n=1 Tax=Acuticoccus mangrovi TaxID=2796142 RepID=A0A934IDM9_9HYPH|nr:alpha/beta fold hydrolase [Acuticoccus mangrovi]MBJ3774618.1 alpha/beta hydrolase [Acuticoccus mangrovi]